MDESQVLLDCGRGGIPADAVNVAWDDAAPPPLSDCAAARMENRWQAALAEARATGKRLFDGPITQLIEAGGTPGQNALLRVRPGSYRAFLVTRLRDRPWFEAHAPQACTPALGNSVLLTHAGAALLGVRADSVSCYAGRAHLIGGVLEALGTPEYPAHVEGLIAHLLLELREEAGISPVDLMSRGPWPRLLGIFQDNVLGQPEAIWQWETRTPLAAIAQQLDASEHNGHMLMHGGAVDEKVQMQLTPLARRAIAAWQQ